MSGARRFIVIVFVTAGNCVSGIALVENWSMLRTWAINVASGESHNEMLL